MNCPSIKELLFYLRDGSDAPEEGLQWEMHLSHCQACREKLDQLAHQESLPELLGLEPDLVPASEALPRDLLRVGLDGYQVHELVGKGGFGQVYRATHLSTGRTVAIKYSTNADPDDIALAKSEAEIAAKLDHPNLVRLFDYGSHGTCTYTVFEWVESDLQQQLKAQAMAIDEAIPCFLKIAEGVAHLHRLKLIHRDLKPSNVLLTSDGEPKLADFGIMKRLSEQGETRFSRIIGTPEYMAPEQLGYLGLPADQRVDIYGLGGVLYTMLLGKSPYQENGPVTLRQVIEIPPTALHQADPLIPEDLSQICAKCLAKLPSDRYATVDDLIEDIHRWQKGFPVSARPLPGYRRSWRIARRHPAMLATVTLLVMSLISLVATLASTRGKLNAPSSLSPSEVWTKKIASSNDRILEVLAEARRELADPPLARALETIAKASPLTPSMHLGLLAYFPDSNSLPAPLLKEPMGWREFIASLPLQDVHQLSTRLHPRVVNIDWLATTSALASFRQARDENAKRNWIVWMAGMQSLDQLQPRDREKLLIAMRDLPPHDMDSWRSMLAPIRNDILDTFLQVGSQAKEGLALSERPTPWFAYQSLQAWLWPWIQQEDERLIQWIELCPWEYFGWLKQLPQQTQASFSQRLMERWNIAMQEEDTHSSLSIAFQSEVEAHSGFVTKNHGVVPKVPLWQLPEWEAILERSQVAPCSLQVYEQEGETYLAMAFEHSQDPFEIEVDVPLLDMASRMKMQAARGFQPIAIWGRSLDSTLHVSTLWSQGDWGESQLLTTALARQQTLDRWTSSPNHDGETRVREQWWSPKSATPFLALATLRVVPSRVAGEHRLVYLPRTKIGSKSEVETACVVEFERHRQEFAVVAPCDPTTHSEQASILREGGFQPIAIYVDPLEETFHSHWCKNLDSAKDTPASNRPLQSAKSRAAIAWACWLLGNPAPLLEALEHRRDPTLRTEVVEATSTSFVDPELLLDLHHRHLTPAQIQGLLLSIWNADITPTSWSPPCQTFLEQAWHHPDGGVHITAEKWMQRRAPELLASLKEARGKIQNGVPNQNQQWYEGPFGIPFTMIDMNSWELIGVNEEIPWIFSVNRRLINPQTRLAVSTIETPEWLMQEYLKETNDLAAGADAILNRNPEGPAVGYDLPTILRFCRWYSEKAGLPGDSITLPPREEITLGMQLPNRPDGKPGYRLPTNYEWELVCRAGTWTTSPLGRAVDHLNEYSWNSSNSDTKHFPIGLLKPNRYGLFDILGNAFEVTLGETPESGFSSFGPEGTLQILGPNTVVCLRGGSFLSSRIYCTSGSQNHINALIHDINAGFRMVQTVSDQGTSESHEQRRNSEER